VPQDGITEQTYYRWKAKYSGLELSEARRLRQLEDENRGRKNLVADLTLDNTSLRKKCAFWRGQSRWRFHQLKSTWAPDQASSQ